MSFIRLSAGIPRRGHAKDTGSHVREVHQVERGCCGGRHYLLNDPESESSSALLCSSPDNRQSTLPCEEYISTWLIDMRDFWRRGISNDMPADWTGDSSFCYLDVGTNDLKLIIFSIL